MKKLLFVILFLCVSLFMFAQSVSYANAVKISKMTSITEINGFIKTLGYQLSETYPEMKKDTAHTVVDVYWRYGGCSVARRRDFGGGSHYSWDINYPSAGIKVQLCRTHNCVNHVEWLFISNRTYSNLMQQFKQYGWKLVAEEVDSEGLLNYYRKEKQSNWINIEETDNCYYFNYCTGR